MKRLMRTTALLAVIVMSGPALAVDVYRCTARDGGVRFQDMPCAGNETSQSIRLVDDPPRVSTPLVPLEAEKRTGPDPGSVVMPSAPVAAPWRSAHLCVRDDGRRYLSDSGFGERRAVPLAMLGIPGRGLAEAYGPGGAGISAPGVHAPHPDRSPQGHAGGSYVWVEDPCELATGEQVCGFLAAEIDAAERRLRHAFSDTSAQVRAEIAALRERAAACVR